MQMLLVLEVHEAEHDSPCARLAAGYSLLLILPLHGARHTLQLLLSCSRHDKLA